jgi:anion-transporting  ArsA/GET3 family ATPase
VVVTGKGGVGKTTIAAVLASRLARAGERVLVLEVDPREGLHLAFDRAPSGGEVVAAGERLAFQNLQPRAVLDALVRERLHVGLLAKRVLASPIYRHFTDGAPGLRELAILGHALRTLKSGERDVVVLDAPATGHALALLRAPRLVADVIERGPVGALASELAAFVADRERCRVVVVTRAEELPLAESLELIGELGREGHTPETLVVNGVVPPVPLVERSRAGGDDAIGVLWRERRALAERVLARLDAGAADGVSQVRLPLLPRSLGPALVSALVESFGAA